MRYCGKIGYVVTVDDDTTGICAPSTVEKVAKGDVLTNHLRVTDGVNTNPDITISNRLSIVSEPFLLNNFQNIKYATWKGTKWSVESVEIALPRVILSLGGVYNG